MVQFRCNLDNPYRESIVRFFQQQFPAASHVSKADRLELLTDVLTGTKETRLGNVPKPEALVTIRETLRRAIELDAPVPVLVPWGGRKMNPGYKIDVAEVSALKQLVKLDQTMRQFHQPGMHIHLGVEDMGAEWLYKTDAGIEEYASGLVTLVELLRGDTHIEAIRESLLMDKSEYFRISHDYAYLLDEVIKVVVMGNFPDGTMTTAYRELKARGWQGELPRYQIDYYLSRYEALYPDSSFEQRVVMLADYFAGAKARYDLDGKAEPDSAVGSYIKLSFVPPIPGAPEGLTNNTVYWRTIPYSSGRTHIAPWRAKGYLRIDKEGRSVVKLMSQGDPLIHELHRDYVTIEGSSNRSVVVDTSYLLTD